MPTYKNNMDKPVVTTSGFVVESMEKIELPNYIEDGLLKLVNDKPYYNPIAYVHKSFGDDEIDLVDWDKIDGIEVFNSNNDVALVYLTNVDNEPAIPIFPNSVRYIWLNSSVKKLVIKGGKYVIYVTEIKDKNSISIRGM